MPDPPSHSPTSIPPDSPLAKAAFTPADDATRLARSLALASSKVSATFGLIDDGNTVPFIARYWREATIEGKTRLTNAVCTRRVTNSTAESNIFGRIRCSRSIAPKTRACSE